MGTISRSPNETIAFNKAPILEYRLLEYGLDHNWHSLRLPGEDVWVRWGWKKGRTLRDHLFYHILTLASGTNVPKRCFQDSLIILPTVQRSHKGSSRSNVRVNLVCLSCSYWRSYHTYYWSLIVTTRMVNVSSNILHHSHGAPVVYLTVGSHPSFWRQEASVNKMALQVSITLHQSQPLSGPMFQHSTSDHPDCI